MNDFLVLGHRGYLGSYLSKNLLCDTLSARDIYDNGNKYKFVINCIGKPDLEYCESNPCITEYSNALVLEDIKINYPDSKIINFSSYYVYDFDGLCSEKSNVTEKYHYCKQNLLGEKINADGLNFRIGKLFGGDLNGQNKLTEHIILNDELKIDTAIFNPTSLKCILEVIKNKQFINEEKGIFNLSNDGIVNHYDYATYIVNRLKLNKDLKKIKNQLPRFSNYGRFAMSIDKIKNHCKIKSWQQDLNEYLENVC